VQRVRGYLAEAQADYAGAVVGYQRAVELHPDFSYLWLALGNAYRAQQNYAEALKAYQRGADLAPRDARIEAALGSVHLAQDEYQSALTHYLRAAELDPDYATPPGQIGWVYYKQRQYAKAQPYFEHAVEMEKSPGRKAQYLHALGWISLKGGNPAAARDLFKQALALDPTLQGARDGLAEAGS
jgi:tetratricopeptide (TPR) repeat protein